MRIKLIKTILIVIVSFICLVLAIGAKFYVKSVQSFKTLSLCVESEMVENNNSCYLELKNSIKDSYTKKFVELINETSLELSNSFNNILGDKYKEIKIEEENLDRAQREERNAFFETQEYVDAKARVADIKLKLDNATEEQKDLYLDEFRAALSNLSTLNTKLNNLLKTYRDRQLNLKTEIKELFDTKKEELLSTRASVMKSTREKIFNLISNYNVEINELNASFNVVSDKREYPFDINSINTVSVCGKLESEYFNEVLELEDGAKTQILLLLRAILNIKAKICHFGKFFVAIMW